MATTVTAVFISENEKVLLFLVQESGLYLKAQNDHVLLVFNCLFVKVSKKVDENVLQINTVLVFVFDFSEWWCPLQLFFK